VRPSGLTPSLVAGALVLAAGTVWWHVAGPLVLASPRFTIYQLAFLGTLTVAIVAALRAEEGRAILVATVMLIGWALHQTVHSAGTHPLSLHGAINLGMAVAVTAMARERWEGIVALLLLSIVALGALTHFGAVPGIAERTRGAFIAWSYPDIAAVLGHIANLVTGAAADGGRRVRSSPGAAGEVAWLRRPVRMALGLGLGAAHRRRRA
jgi:hypothetical protein